MEISGIAKCKAALHWLKISLESGYAGRNMKLFPLLLSVIGLHGSPVGNPAFPRLIEQGFFIPETSSVSVRIGYEGDFVSDARLEQDKEGAGRVDNFGQNTNSGTVTLNYANRIDLYTVLGASQFCADWRFEIFEDSILTIHRAQMETLTQFLWGVGGQAILYETDTLTLGAGGRYSFCDAEVLWLAVDALSQSVAGALCRWDEWQIDLDFSFHIDLFTPYLGVKYSSAHAWVGSFSVPISMNDLGVNHFESRIPLGFFLGCTISNGKYFMLNVEARLIDEEAVTISGDLRF